MKVIDKLHLTINYDCGFCKWYSPRKLPHICSKGFDFERNLNYKRVRVCLLKHGGIYVRQKFENKTYVACEEYELT